MDRDIGAGAPVFTIGSLSDEGELIAHVPRPVVLLGKRLQGDGEGADRVLMPVRPHKILLSVIVEPTIVQGMLYFGAHANLLPVWSLSPVYVASAGEPVPLQGLTPRVCCGPGE